MFLFLYFKEYETRKEIEQQNQLMEMKRVQTEKELEAIRRSERAVSILRHDMRHFLSSIVSYIENDENDKALAYIREVIHTSDQTAMQRYCKNEIVNLILSSHRNEIEHHKICFEYSIQLPEELSISDIDMTAILSNGLENAMTELARLNLPKLLNLLLHQGKDTCSDKTFRMKNQKSLVEFETYEELEQAYLNELEYWVRKIIRNLNRIEHLYAEKYPLPYLSVLTEDCIGSRKDVMAGGARYTGVGFNLGGIGTAVDALAAIQDVIYDKNMLTLEECVEITDHDFENADYMLQYMSARAPKYGNDQCRKQDADRIAVKMERMVSDILKEYRNYWGGPYRLGLYTVEDHAIMGMHTGATADGRKSGESLSNSSGASQGKDTHGPTALINSVTNFPMEEAGNGMVLDVKFTPSLLEEETGKRALRSLIVTYFHKGGREIQISIVSVETLRAAQEHPENYADLIVRVSGFSAYFCSLRKATQDEIIKRTEHVM